VTDIDPDIHDEHHETAATRLQAKIAGGYAAATLGELARRETDEAAEEARFEWETARCHQCAKTRHPSCVCTKHRQRWGIPE
jgi:hypothetical protein